MRIRSLSHRRGGADAEEDAVNLESRPVSTSGRDVTFRAFESSDYDDCEALVSEAWQFDLNFQPQDLANVAKRIYTYGSLLGSNYRAVAEYDGRVAGFLFGFAEPGARPRGGIRFALRMVWRILCIKALPLKKKKALLAAIYDHGLNRSMLVKEKQSEVVLFVVRSDCQGRGYGKRLLSEFLSHCEALGVKSVVVETNRTGASGFYEQQGFTHIGDFFSPLHAYASRHGQACMYRYDFD